MQGSGYRNSALSVAGLLLVFSAVHCRAEQVARYTLDDCIRIGLERNAAVVNARRDREIAATRIGQARSSALPHLSLSGSYSRLDELQTIDFGGEEIELGTLDNYSANIGIAQLLYSGGKVGAALRAAGLAESQADWAYAEAEAVFKRDVRTAFYDLLLADAVVDVARDSLAQLESLLKQTGTREKNGTASEFDVIRARVRVSNEKARVVRARNSRAVAREALRRLLNVAAEDIEIAGKLRLVDTPVKTDELQREALLHRPGVRAMEFTCELYKENVAAARSEGRPSISAQFNYNGANSYEFVSYEDTWEWHWNAGLVMQWSLWDGGLTRNTVREKRLEAEKMLTALDDLRSAVRLQVKRHCLDLGHARESVEASEGAIALAEKAMRIAETRHKQGLATHLDVTDANLALSTARLTRLQALHEHMSALARLRYACGMEELPAERRDGGDQKDE